MEEHGRVAGALKVSPVAVASEEELVPGLRESVKALGDAVTCPLEHLILGNAALTLLELSGQPFSFKEVYALLVDERARLDAIRRLSEETPAYWSEEWNGLWGRDIDPLLSVAQERAVKRLALMAFWRKEWYGLSAEVKNRLAGALKAMIGDG